MKIKTGTLFIRAMVIVLLLFLSLSCFSFALVTTYKHRDDTANLAFNQGNIYIGIQHEANPLQLEDSPKTLDSFLQIYDTIRSSPYTYYEIYQQPIDGMAQGQFFPNYYDNVSFDSDQALCLQISENVQTDFDLSILSGRFFNAGDFIHESGTTVPVIMGYEYSQMYSVGDVFSAGYLLSQFDFEIIGFLNNGCNISTSSFYIPLNRVIIIPSFRFRDLPQSANEYVTQKIHYANKTSGKFKIPEEMFDEAYAFVTDLTAKSNVGKYSLTSTSFEEINRMRGFDLKICFVVSSLLCLIFAGAALFSLKRLCGNHEKKLSPVRRIVIASAVIGIAFLLSLIPSYYFYLQLGFYFHATLLHFIFIGILWIVSILILGKKKCVS